jgi:OmpA-OmpF porin, OOP family
MCCYTLPLILRRKTGAGVALAIMLSILAASPRGAAADDWTQALQPGDSLSTEAGYALPARSLGTTGHGLTGSVIYGLPLRGHLDLELNLHGSIFQTPPHAGTAFYQEGLNADAVYELDPLLKSFVNPFVLAGIGGARDNFYPDWRDRNVLVEEAGVGLITRPVLSNGLRLRLDARWVRDPNEGGHSEGRVMFGFYIPLGWAYAEPPPRVTVREVVKVKVVKEVVMQAPPPTHCRNTLPGARVDAAGCLVARQAITLHGVTFDFNKSDLGRNADTVLDMVVSTLATQPSLRIEIAGYTDGSGSADYNLKLSQRRAEAVRNYLIAHGVPAAELAARGYGKAYPLVDPEKSSTDRERNRRVELRVDEQQESRP